VSGIDSNPPTQWDEKREDVLAAQRSGKWAENRPEYGAHPTWLRGGASVSQAVNSQQAGSTLADPSSRHDASAALAFRTAFLGRERQSCRTEQRAIGLWREDRGGNSSHLCRVRPLWQPVGDLREWLRSRGRKGVWVSGSTVAGTHCGWMEAMAQFQTQVPHPLAPHVPAFLSTCAL
jgi:hypothetical protein